MDVLSSLWNYWTSFFGNTKQEIEQPQTSSIDHASRLWICPPEHATRTPFNSPVGKTVHVAILSPSGNQKTKGPSVITYSGSDKPIICQTSDNFISSTTISHELSAASILDLSPNSLITLSKKRKAHTESKSNEFFGSYQRSLIVGGNRRQKQEFLQHFMNDKLDQFSQVYIFTTNHKMYPSSCVTFGKLTQNALTTIQDVVQLETKQNPLSKYLIVSDFIWSVKKGTIASDFMLNMSKYDIHFCFLTNNFPYLLSNLSFDRIHVIAALNYPSAVQLWNIQKPDPTMPIDEFTTLLQFAVPNYTYLTKELSSETYERKYLPNEDELNNYSILPLKKQKTEIEMVT